MARSRARSPAPRRSQPKPPVGGAATGTNITALEQLTEYFRPYGIPPTPIHEVLQQAAERAGWMPPQQLETQRAQKVAAARKSAASRAGLKQIGCSLVMAAREQLPPKYRKNLHSSEALTALHHKFRGFFEEGDHGFIVAAILAILPPADRERLKRTKRNTVVAYLKRIIRLSKR
jgi:hypothetical protein